MQKLMATSLVDRKCTFAASFRYTNRHRIGAFGISFGLPFAVYLATFLCNDISGCPVPSALSPSTLTIAQLKQDVGWPANGVYGLASWDVTLKVLGYYLFSAILHKVLPGEEVEGTVLANGGKLKYKFNSASAW